MNKFKKFLSKVLTGVSLAALIVPMVVVAVGGTGSPGGGSGGVGTPSTWTNQSNALYTNPVNADIHVGHCYIGAGTGTPCAAGGGAVTSITGNAPITATGSSAVTVGCQTVSTSQGGCLTAAQYQTITTGDQTSVSVATATGSPLAANTYSNGASGVGATITINSPGIFAAVNGVTLSLNDRILIKNETVASHNGPFSYTTVGTATVSAAFTRATDSDTSAELDNQTVAIQSGSLAGQFWGQNTNMPVVGTDAINYTQQNGNGVIQSVSGTQTAGNYPCWTTNARELSKLCATPISVTQGGMGLIAGTSGGIPFYSGTASIASSAALTAAHLVVGGGAGVAPTVIAGLGTTTNVFHGNAAGVGSFGPVVGSDMTNNTVGNAQLRTGVARSVIGVTGNGTANVADIQAGSANLPLTSNSSNTGISFAALTVPGGGTGIVTSAIHGVLIGNAANPLVTTAVGTNGQMFLGQTSADPAWKTATISSSVGAFSLDQNGSFIFPDAAVSTRGFVSAGTQTFDGAKTFNATTTTFKHISAGPSAVTNTPGTGAGTTPSVTVNGFDAGGHISVVAGTAPTAGGTIVTVTYNQAYTNVPDVVFSPTNATAGALSPSIYIDSSGTASFGIKLQAGIPLVLGQTYTWDYHVLANNG